MKVSYASGSGGPPGAKAGVEGIIESMPLHEVWDVLDSLKQMAEAHTAHDVLDAHPQLVPALLQCQRRLGLGSSR